MNKNEPIEYMIKSKVVRQGLFCFLIISSSLYLTRSFPPGAIEEKYYGVITIVGSWVFSALFRKNLSERIVLFGAGIVFFIFLLKLRA